MTIGLIEQNSFASGVHDIGVSCRFVQDNQSHCT